MTAPLIVVRSFQILGVTIMGGFQLAKLWWVADAILHGAPELAAAPASKEEWWRANTP